MKFDWKEYLSIAQYFQQLSLKKSVGDIILSNEAIHRAGISRAYYSAFCFCRNTAQKEGFPNKFEKGESIHENLITFYKSKNPNLSRDLNTLRLWRVLSDYKEEFPNKNSFEILGKSIKLTLGIFKILEQSKHKKDILPVN